MTGLQQRSGLGIIHNLPPPPPNNPSSPINPTTSTRSPSPTNIHRTNRSIHGLDTSILVQRYYLGILCAGIYFAGFGCCWDWGWGGFGWGVWGWGEFVRSSCLLLLLLLLVLAFSAARGDSPVWRRTKLMVRVGSSLRCVWSLSARA